MGELRSTTVGEFLVQSLKQVGIDHIFGVPGDYVLDLMDIIEESSIQLIGNCNELNASYAADAYARVRGIGAVCVTFNVGGFSALNGIAGAYAERVPLVFISGSPSFEQRNKNSQFHHKVKGYNTQMKIFEHVTIASVMLQNPQEAPGQIIHVLESCLKNQLPVYLEVPMDLVHAQCWVDPELKVSHPIRTLDPKSLQEAVQDTLAILKKAKNPMILVGTEIARYGLQNNLLQFIEKTGLPFLTTLETHSTISSRHPQYAGVFDTGVYENWLEIKAAIADADALLVLGGWMNDLTMEAPSVTGQLIVTNLSSIRINHHYYHHIGLHDFLASLNENWNQDLQHSPAPNISHWQASKTTLEPLRDMTAEKFYQRFESYVEPGWIVISDTGDSLFGIVNLHFANHVKFIGQAYYLSIGYATPATLGASFAAPSRRVVALVGDGAFQMTAQELSTIVRYKLNPIIFIMNNQGYLTERLVHKLESSYNDIQPWKYHMIPHAFGEARSWDVHNEGEFETALVEAKNNLASPSFIEIHLDKMDASAILKKLGLSYQKYLIDHLDY